MKKILLLTLIILSFTTSVLAGCNLDESRWKWLFSTDKCGCYYDRNTANVKSESDFEVWICDYYPGIASCDAPVCIEAAKDKEEHYHYKKIEYYTKYYTYMIKYFLYRDSKGNVIASDEVPFHKAKPVPPNSIGEAQMTKIRADINQFR